MYKNQLHELAQRSCFNLPSYTCLRDGPDHSPRFKSTVYFQGESFQCHGFFPTLRQAEHSAAEAALLSLSSRSISLASRILDETGVYKNLLQEISQRVGAPLPQYTTFRSGLGHQPVFTGTVELTGIIFTGEPAKNKKQAEKNAAMAAWSCLKQLVKESDVSSEPEKKDQLEQVTIARALLNYKSKEKFAFGGGSSSKILFPKLSSQNPRPSSPQPPSVTSSKILPLICPKTGHLHRSYSPAKDNVMPPMPSQRYNPVPKFLAFGASPYIPIDQFRAASCRGLAPPVTIRTAVPVYAAPPPPPPPSTRISSPLVRIAPPGCINPEVPTAVDNLLLRIQQQESTPAIAPLPLVNNLREPVVTSPRPSLHMQKQEAAPAIAPSLQHAVQDVSPFKGLQESEVALLTRSLEQINT